MLKRIINYIKKIIKVCFYYFCCLLPIQKKRIIADNFNGSCFGDNTGAIVKKLLEKDETLEVYWTYDLEKNPGIRLPKGIRGVQFGSVKHYYILATSKIWIFNVRNPLKIRKRKRQFYIQTWHAGFGFKRVEADAAEALPKWYIKMAKNDSKNIDLIITNSDWEIEYFKKVFYYKGNYIKTGLPRCDELFYSKDFSSIRQEIHKKFSIPMTTKILLYAPTFRDDGNTSCYDIDYEGLLSTLKKKTNESWVILMRLHPNIANMEIFNSKNKNVINVSKYESLNKLMIASDFLISDYSSLMFEFGYLSKPIIVYASDIEKYKNERGLLWNFKDLPFPFSKTNDELKKCIMSFTEVKYIEKLKKFYKKNGLLDDGHASERVAKIIMNKINE